MIEWFWAVLVGTATGILSGFGIGGGTLLLIYLTTFSGIDQTLAQGINLLYFLPAAATALPSHIKNGYLRKDSAIPAILIGLLFSAVSAWIATSLNVALLRKFFGIFLLYIGISELFRRDTKKEPGARR